MKKINISLLLLVTFLGACNNYLEIEPKNKLPGDILFSSPDGVRHYMANLYYQLPIEDFAFFPTQGFNYNTIASPNNGGFNSAMFTDEAAHSEFNKFIANSDFAWWTEGYKLNRDANLLASYIPDLEISDEEKKMLVGEVAFIKAYTYFALAKRYGGVPIIDALQEYTGISTDTLALRVPRSTEVDTWNYVLKQCDIATENLPDVWTGKDERRATKWAAYALKSRIALHAASLAKYWSLAPLSGKAVDEKLVGGFTLDDEDNYYLQCIEASRYLMDNAPFSLYRPSPSSVSEAITNYQTLFESPNLATEEAIFIKGFFQSGLGTSHNYDIWYNPNQTSNGWIHPGRMNPTLDFVDLYENYNDPGKSSLIITREDGELENYWNSTEFETSVIYKKYDHPLDIFEGKDARLFASVILPYSQWKKDTIVIQGGLIKPNGNSDLILTNGNYTKDGIKYYSFGKENPTQYSGFDTYAGNMTRTGFGFKKFLQEKENIPGKWNQSTNDFIDIRYAEVLLNFAEAVVESGYMEDNSMQVAALALNSIRKRAGHTVNIPLTLENVLRERRVELAFEGKRYWDLIRRREYHTEFNNRVRYALQPILDLRETDPKYIFLRRRIRYENGKTFQSMQYYRPIPGTASNGATQNPQY